MLIKITGSNPAWRRRPWRMARLCSGARCLEASFAFHAEACCAAATAATATAATAAAATATSPACGDLAAAARPTSSPTSASRPLACLVCCGLAASPSSPGGTPRLDSAQLRLLALLAPASKRLLPAPGDQRNPGVRLRGAGPAGVAERRPIQKKWWRF